MDALGDVDVDGFADFVASGPEADVSGTDDGVAYVVRGPVTAPGDLADHVRIVGDDAGDRLGYGAGGGGDFDGDGAPDLVLAAPDADDGGAGSGAAYVLLGGGL
jgi:hypothetical protein